MFTGLIEEQGKILSVSKTGGFMRLCIGCSKVLEALRSTESASQPQKFHAQAKKVVFQLT